MNFFDDRDFGKHLEPHLPINAECATLVANSKLERDGIKGFAQRHKRGEWAFTEQPRFGDTHRAVLINLEEISPCIHKKEDVQPDITTLHGFRCTCGTAMEPVSFMEKK